MKKILFFTYFIFISSEIFSQIFSNNTENGAIKIMPKGISDRLDSAPELPVTNTGLGSDALKVAATVTNNTAIGYKTLNYLTTNSPNDYNGNNNTAVGYNVLLRNLEGYNNSAFGYLAIGNILNNPKGNNNTAFGSDALFFNFSGNNNSAFGKSALSNNYSGNNNTAYGAYSLTLNAVTHFNTAFGVRSLFNHTEGDNNTAFGAYALVSDESGIYNAALGNASLQNNISGSMNSACGGNSSSNTKTGIANVALGQSALNNSAGQYNIGIGMASLSQNTSGSTNTVIGNNSANMNTIGSGNVIIGNYSGYYETGSNKLYIDSNTAPAGATTTLIGGDLSSSRKVCINCNMSATGVNDFNNRTEAFQVQGQAFKKLGSGNWVFPSDRRLKTDIIALNSKAMLKNILTMQGVNYKLIAFPEQGIQYGFIAQDLQKVFPTKVYHNPAGYLSASYGSFTPILIEALKGLNEKLEKLEQNHPDIKALTARLNEMESLYERIAKKE